MSGEYQGNHPVQPLFHGRPGLSSLAGVRATPDFVTLDSGVRHKESTGAQRDASKGKGRFDLIPPVPLLRLAQLYERGAEKYEERNWEKGINLSRYLDSAMRHINDYRRGDRAEDHLTAAVWNLFGFVATEQWIKDGKLPPALNNMPKNDGGSDETKEKV